ncbi:hypothetical protein LZ575_12600 [Antarcticibacterium sp. 1MA-6-2]|uniref:hypothetical protein n=1 Tax=Antarcticibacterium sp. 1MA-6-2 TaxID=2908210 RepID=UPI001F477920|nr:hypothetical protein [Antarcticibacterium sp. 1MA-6-2]UJH89839.1 hypothetical protein LZ575_12600 [Antarcticibacterium sp. 1MA-6-2]
MKNLAVLFILSFISFSTQAQRIIEKNINYKNQEINIEVPFASEIELKTWDKNTVYVKADLTMSEGKYLDLYELNIEESNDRIEVISNAEPLFKEWQKDYRRNYPGKAEDSDKKPKNNNVTYSGDQIIITDEMEYTFNYVIYIPEGAEVKISSINGNLYSEVIT